MQKNSQRNKSFDRNWNVIEVFLHTFGQQLTKSATSNEFCGWTTNLFTRLVDAHMILSRAFHFDVVFFSRQHIHSHWRYTYRHIRDIFSTFQHRWLFVVTTQKFVTHYLCCLSAEAQRNWMKRFNVNTVNYWPFLADENEG